MSYFGKLNKAPPYGYPVELDEMDSSLMSPKSSSSGLRGLRPSFYGQHPEVLPEDVEDFQVWDKEKYAGDIEVEICPDRIYYKGDTMSAIALSVVAAALIKYM
jgi:hypothetical protein